MTERQRKFLEVLAADTLRHIGLPPGRIFFLAFPDENHGGRRDAGATRTLDGMQKLGWVVGRYPAYEMGFATGRYWKITDDGRKALANDQAL